MRSMVYNIIFVYITRKLSRHLLIYSVGNVLRLITTEVITPVKRCAIPCEKLKIQDVLKKVPTNLIIITNINWILLVIYMYLFIYNG